MFGAVPVGILMFGMFREWQAQKRAADVHFNAADWRALPPVECPLLIRVNGTVLRASRTSHIERPGGDMDYVTDNGRVLVGRFDWTYP